MENAHDLTCRANRYLICGGSLTELPIGIARQELERYHEQWRNMLEESALPDRVSPELREMLFCILCTALSRIEY